MPCILNWKQQLLAGFFLHFHCKKVMSKLHFAIQIFFHSMTFFGLKNGTLFRFEIALVLILFFSRILKGTLHDCGYFLFSRNNMSDGRQILIFWPTFYSFSL